MPFWLSGSASDCKRNGCGFNFNLRKLITFISLLCVFFCCLNTRLPQPIFCSLPIKLEISRIYDKILDTDCVLKTVP